MTNNKSTIINIVIVEKVKTNIVIVEKVIHCIELSGI